MSNEHSHRWLPFALFICCALALSAGLGLAETRAEAEIEQALIPVADAYIASGSPSVNMGTVPEFRVGREEPLGTQRALLRFDLSGLPLGSSIREAHLECYLLEHHGPSSVNVGIFAVTQAWSEIGLTWDNQPETGDFQTFRSIGTSNRYYSWDLTPLVQQWYAHPEDNHGVELQILPEYLGPVRIFASREREGLEPRLVVVLDLAATPTPTSEPSATPTSTPTQTAMPTPTPQPTQTSTYTPWPTATATPLMPSATPSPTQTATPTPTPSPSPTPTSTRTSEPATVTPTSSPTSTPHTSTPTPTMTQRPTDIPTATPAWSATPTATPGGNIVPVDYSLRLDDAPPGMTVNKVAGDAAGPAGLTQVDVIARVISRDERARQGYVIITVPGDLFGPPVSCTQRVRRWDYEEAPTEVDSLGGGRYGAYVWLEDRGGVYVRELVMRFEIPEDTLPQIINIQAELQVPGYTVPEPYREASLRLIEVPEALIITNRDLLYRLKGQDGNGVEVTRLLEYLYDIAQGPPANANPPGVIYYVEDYAPSLSDWNDFFVDYTSEESANAAATLVDNLIEDWVDDRSAPENADPSSLGGPIYLLIIGDDEIVPFYRVLDPAREEANYRYNKASGRFFVIMELVRHGYIFTDAPYADWIGHDWQIGGVELAVGRIVGLQARDMRLFLRNGVMGPRMTTGRAVIASSSIFDWDLADGPDALDALRDRRGLDVRNDDETPRTIDNDDWGLDDLIATMRLGFSCFAFGGYGEHDSLRTPEGTCLQAGTLALHNLASSFTVHRPLLGIGASRVGFSLASDYDDSLIYDWVRYGASGIVASTGLTNGNGEEGAAYAEQLLNDFWLRLFPNDGRSLPVGQALRDAKRFYDAGGGWNGGEQKTVAEFTLFGVPWMTITGAGGAALPSSRTHGPSNITLTQGQDPTQIFPSIMSAHTYTISRTVTADEYHIRSVEGGFHFVEIDGMPQSMSDEGPVLPYTDFSIPLPSGEVEFNLQATAQDPINLGLLNIPMLFPAIYHQGATSGTYVQTPFYVGVYPRSPITWTLRPIEGYNLLDVSVVPVSYDAVTDQTILFSRVDFRGTFTLENPVAILEFEPEYSWYVPGQMINARATLANCTPTPLALTGECSLVTDLGEIVAYTGVEVPVLSPGEVYTLPISLPAPAEWGNYHLRLRLSDGDESVAAQEASLMVLGAAITSLSGPENARPGEDLNLQLTMVNYRNSPMSGTAQMIIRDADGLVVAEGPPRPLTIWGHATITTLLYGPIPWNARGDYAAEVIVTMGNQMCGPTEWYFSVAPALFVPVVRK